MTTKKWVLPEDYPDTYNNIFFSAPVVLKRTVYYGYFNFIRIVSYITYLLICAFTNALFFADYSCIATLVQG